MNSMNALLWPNKRNWHRASQDEHNKTHREADLTAFRSSVASLRVELAVYRYGENASDG